MNGGLVFASIAQRSGALVILDASRRLYVGLSHDEAYWHIVRPLRPEDFRVQAGKASVGELTCECVGGQTHGTCWRLKEAIAFEAGDADRLAAPRWMRDIAPETELERAAARG